MKKAWLGVCALVLGLVALLGFLAYSLDHLRASARVVPGLGEAAEPGRLEALVVPEEGAGEDALEVARQVVPAAVRESTGLVVRVVDEEGKRVSFVDVLAYRDGELVRANYALGGNASMIPFDGPGTLHAEIDGFELARLEIPQGRGRYEIVVPPQACVAGIARVDGVPREGISLRLSTGSDDWLATWVAYGLETAGLHERPSEHVRDTEADGTFRYDGLAPDWSGVLRLEDPELYRFASGASKIELSRPEEALVLELEAIHAELEIRGRVVSAGQPVPEARLKETQVFRAEGATSCWKSCDEFGRFTVHARMEVEELNLDFSEPERGVRRLTLRGAEIRPDLGDIELLPTRAVPFVVSTRSGEPIVGARMHPRAGPHDRDVERRMALTLGASPPCSAPTDANGHGLLPALAPNENLVRVSARGYASADAIVPEDVSAPLAVVLDRASTVQVVVRDRAGRVPPGLFVHIEASGPLFAWANGKYAEGDEVAPGGMNGRWSWTDGGISGDLRPDSRGRVWIDPLRPGQPFDLWATDAHGSVLAAPRRLALAPGEWHHVDFRIEAAPRTLLVVVRDTLGNPLPGAWLRVAPTGGPESRASSLRTDRAGMVRTEPLYSDDVTLRVSRNGFESRTLEHVAVPPEGATVELRLAHDWWPW